MITGNETFIQILYKPIANNSNKITLATSLLQHIPWYKRICNNIYFTHTHSPNTSLKFTNIKHTLNCSKSTILYHTKSNKTNTSTPHAKILG